MKKSQVSLSCREIPALKSSNVPISSSIVEPEFYLLQTNRSSHAGTSTRLRGNVSNFASLSMEEKKEEREFYPTSNQLLKRPLALLALVPKDAALFAAGAIAGAAAKTVTAPLDRIKLLMQVHMFLLLHFPLLFSSAPSFLVQKICSVHWITMVNLVCLSCNLLSVMWVISNRNNVNDTSYGYNVSNLVIDM